MTVVRIDGVFCDPGGARTLDPLIKSQLLYLLGYEVMCFCSPDGIRTRILRCDRAAHYQLYYRTMCVVRLRLDSNQQPSD